MYTKATHQQAFITGTDSLEGVKLGNRPKYANVRRPNRTRIHRECTNS